MYLAAKYSLIGLELEHNELDSFLFLFLFLNDC